MASFCCNPLRPSDAEWRMYASAHYAIIGIESTKTTYMEDTSTGVLEKNKEYLRSKDKAKK